MILYYDGYFKMITNVGIIIVLIIFNFVSRPKATEINIIRGLTTPYKSLDLTDRHNRSVKLDGKLKHQLLEFLSQNLNFALCIQFQLPKNGTTGSLLSVRLKDNLRLLELKLSSKRNKLRISYLPKWASRGFLITDIRLASHFQKRKNQLKQNICILYNGKRLEIKVIFDCKKELTVTKHLYYALPQSRFQKINWRNVDIWIGQRNADQSFFKGIITKMVISNDSNFVDNFCKPTHVLKMNADQPAVSTLEVQLNGKIQRLEKEMAALVDNMKKLQNAVDKLKACQCLPVCKSTIGVIKTLNDSWSEGTCRECTCTLHGARCSNKTCPSLSCENFVVEEGQCCPRCVRKCQLHGKMFDSGHNFTINCLRCKCNDGSLKCHYINQEKECPKLNCPHYLQVRPKGECCKKCNDLDMCIFSNCGPNTKCQSGKHSFMCICLPGFMKSRRSNNPAIETCIDVDECSLNRTICPPGTKCVNKNGGYDCKCKTGYIYEKGTGCVAHCPSCVAYSKCVNPNKCDCKPGWSGENCDQDINECTTGLVNCPDNSRCVNYAGSYICKCKPGFNANIQLNRSPYNHSIHCQDINECTESKGSQHRCTATQVCVNIKGGHKCIPDFHSNSGSDCQYTNCDGMEQLLKNGQSKENTDTCTRCECQKGVLECRAVKCSCQQPPKQRKCCPNCQYNRGLMCQQSHSTGKLSNLCKNMSCPQLNCNKMVNLDGQCCSFCKGDVMAQCHLGLNSDSSKMNLGQNGAISSSSSWSCITAHRVYRHSQSIIIEHFRDGSCLRCLCWSGSFCCKKTFLC